MKKGNRKSSYKRISQAEKRAIAFMNRRPGDVTRVAKRTGFAVSTVSEALSGKHQNDRIVNVAYDIARKRKGAIA